LGEVVRAGLTPSTVRRSPSPAPQAALDRRLLPGFLRRQSKLAIEIDSIGHDMVTGRSGAKREMRPFAGGLEVIRIPAADVLKSPDEMAEMLVRHGVANAPSSEA
jgi:very-short-patch-repair endonuclease